MSCNQISCFSPNSNIFCRIEPCWPTECSIQVYKSLILAYSERYNFKLLFPLREIQILEIAEISHHLLVPVLGLYSVILNYFVRVSMEIRYICIILRVSFLVLRPENSFSFLEENDMAASSRMAFLEANIKI